MLAQHMDQFFNHCLAKGLARKTIVGYQQYLREFEQFIRDTNLQWTQRHTIEQFFADLRGRSSRWAHHPRKREKMGGLADATLRSYFRALRRFYRWMCEIGFLDLNPVRGFSFARPRRQIPRGVTLEDVLKLYRAARLERDRAILLFLLDTGCRVSELCGLRAADVFVERSFAIVLGKGGQERAVFYAPTTASVLLEYLRVRNTSAEFLFLKTDNASQMTPATVAEMLKRLAKRAGVTGRCNPHSFRHARAREHRLAGGDISTLSEMFGHQDIATTMIYGALPSPALAQVALRTSPVAGLEI